MTLRLLPMGRSRFACKARFFSQKKMASRETIFLLAPSWPFLARSPLLHRIFRVKIQVQLQDIDPGLSQKSFLARELSLTTSVTPKTTVAPEAQASGWSKPR